MKKFLLTCVALLGIGAFASAETVTYTYADQGFENAVELSETTYQGITISYAKGTNSNPPKYYDTSSAGRLYGGNSITFAVAEGSTITDIAFTVDSKNGPFHAESTASAGTFDASAATWTGAAQTVTITQGGTKGHARIQSWTLTYTAGEAPKVAKPTISPNGGWVKTGDEITIACETAGAEIHYTLDGDTPDKSSTKYDGAITVTETEDFILTAVAYVGEDVSSAASANFKIMAKLTALDQIKTCTKEDQVVVDVECVVSYKNGAYNYIYAPADQCYGLIYQYDFVPAVGDKIAAGWTATVGNFKGLWQYTFTEGCEVAESGVALPEPTVIEATNFADLTAEKVPMYVELKNVAFAEDTPESNAAFEGALDTNTVKFYNQFKLESVVAGVYNVKGYLSVRDTDIQILPIAFEKNTESGITDIDATQEAPRYFNLQGVEVANPNAGIYIRVAGGKATKVLVD